MVGVSSQAGLWGEHYSKHGWEGLGLLERSWDRTALGSREGLERESEGRPALPEEGGLCGCSQEEMELSVQFSRSVVSNSLRSHESQHARPPCPSPTPGVHTDSRPSSQ